MIFLTGFSAICIEIRDILPEIGDMQKLGDTLPILKQIGTRPQFLLTCLLNFWYVSLDFKLVHE